MRMQSTSCLGVTCRHIWEKTVFGLVFERMGLGNNISKHEFARGFCCPLKHVETCEKPGGGSWGTHAHRCTDSRVCMRTHTRRQEVQGLRSSRDAGHT